MRKKSCTNPQCFTGRVRCGHCNSPNTNNSENSEEVKLWVDLSDGNIKYIDPNNNAEKSVCPICHGEGWEDCLECN